MIHNNAVTCPLCGRKAWKDVGAIETNFIYEHCEDFEDNLAGRKKAFKNRCVLNTTNPRHKLLIKGDNQCNSI